MGGLLNAATPDAGVVAALQADASSYTWVATLAQFKQYVAEGRIHYFASGGGFAGQQGGSQSASAIASWVASSFTQVVIGSSTFYDLTAPLAGSSSTTSVATTGTV